jgi:hypothetical protein
LSQLGLGGASPDNGQIKHTNGMVLQGLKPPIFDTLNKFTKQWVVELPSVLWSLKMTPAIQSASSLSSLCTVPMCKDL